MKTKAIEFNADALVGSVESFAYHLTGKQKLTLRTVTISLPPPVNCSRPGKCAQSARNLTSVRLFYRDDICSNAIMGSSGRQQ